MLRLSRYLRTKMTLCLKTTDLCHCSRFITGFWKNLCTPDLPSLSKIATFSMISNTAFAVSTVLSMLYLILLTQLSKIWTTVNFINLKKAFDTVNHEILLAKLENYGIRGVINSWFRSYLADRKQNTEVNDIVSDAETALCGVPQRAQSSDHSYSFCILMISSSLFAFYLFADDTSIILENNNLKELESLVNPEVDNVNEWLKANKLSLNIKKNPNFVIFRPRQKNVPFTPRIKILDSVTYTYANLEMKDYVKYLGLMIDSNLSWKYHIESICHKISKSIGIIAKIGHYVPRRVLLSVYNSLIVPSLTYGICGWGNCASTFQRKIVTLQKPALRLIYFSKPKEHTVPFFLKSNCLPLPSLFFRDCSYLLYDINRQTAPVSILNQFVKTSQIHNYRTRSVSSDSFYLKFSRTDKMYAFFSRIFLPIKLYLSVHLPYD